MEKNPDHEKDLTLTVSIPPDKTKRKSALDVAKRMSLIAYISAAVTFLVKRTVFGKIKDMQPDNLPVTIPDEIAFPAWGAAVAGAVMAARKARSGEARVLNRRYFLYVSGSAAGALIGSLVGDVAPKPRLQRSVKALKKGEEEK